MQCPKVPPPRKALVRKGFDELIKKLHDFISPRVKVAFTLAEVLITLGIIGVVAAMTIPTLIQEHKKTVIENRLKKFYTNINQAIKLSELEHGDKKLWADDAKGINGFNEYIGKYMQTLKITNLNGDNLYVLVYFPDSSMVIIKAGYDFFFYPEAKNFSKEKFLKHNDDGSYSRAGSGSEFFAFQFTPNSQDSGHIHHYDKGVEPYKGLLPSNYTREQLMEDGNDYSCNKNSKFKSYCTTLIQYDGWKINKDYPFKF